MKKVLFLLFVISTIVVNSNAQLKRVNTCVSDFEIKLDGVPVTANGVTTFNIVAKPLLQHAEAIANAANCQAQWTPRMFVGANGSKQFTEDFYPQILSITLPVNNGDFYSSIPHQLQIIMVYYHSKKENGIRCRGQFRNVNATVWTVLHKLISC